MRRGLSWPRWRQARAGQLLAQGLPVGLAWPIAKAETAARKRLARMLGRNAARSATLIARDEANGTLRFALTNDPAHSWGSPLD